MVIKWLCCWWCLQPVMLLLLLEHTDWGAVGGARRAVSPPVVHDGCDAAHGRQLHRHRVGARHDGSDTVGGKVQNSTCWLWLTTSASQVGLALDVGAGTMLLLKLRSHPLVSDLQGCPVARGG